MSGSLWRASAGRLHRVLILVDSLLAVLDSNLSDFERTFLPFVEKKGVELAPTNRFLAIKKRKLERAKMSGDGSHASSSTANGTVMDIDPECMSSSGQSASPLQIISL